MSELAMTVAIGPSHLNNGYPSHVDVLGSHLIGGAGTWLFQPLQPIHPDEESRVSVVLQSNRNLIHEIRAGVALALDLGDSRQRVAQMRGPDWAQSPIALDKGELISIGEESRHRGVSMVVTSLDRALLSDLEPHVDDGGWSMILCDVRRKHLEDQWKPPELAG